MIERISDKIRAAEKALDLDDVTYDEPLSFRFYYDATNNQADIIDTIYLEDGNPPSNLVLEVFNESGESINFKRSDKTNARLATVETGGNEAASRTRSHFQIRWAKDLALTPNNIDIEEKQQWQVNYDEDNRFFSMYFLHKNGIILSSQGSPNDNKVRLTFKNMAANNRAVKTSNVELLYGGESSLVFRGEGNSGELIAEQISSTKAIYVTNYPSKQQIPLQVQFLGSNTILNDATTSNNLSLKVINSPLSNNTRPILRLDSTSKFIISFVKGDRPEALVATDDQLKPLNISASPAGWTPKHTANSTEWEFTATNINQLPIGEGIELSITNLVTSSASGLGYLYIDYQNIGSYPDGRLVVAIEKTPLLYREELVGIGTTQPSAKLHIGKVSDDQLGLIIEGSSAKTDTTKTEVLRFVRPGVQNQGNEDKVSFKLGKFEVEKDKKTQLDIALTDVTVMSLREDGNVGIGTLNPSEKLHIHGGNLRIDSGSIKSWGTIDFHANTDKTADENLIRVLKSNGTDVAMLINHEGKLGIGTTAPSAKLHVNDGDAVITGKVGIGTTNPSALLEIKHTGGAETPTDFIRLYNNGDKLNSIQSRIIWHMGPKEYVAAAITSSGTSLLPTSLLTSNDSLLAGKLKFQTAYRGSLSDCMTIDYLGRVGIGTTEPDDKLHINGNLRITNNSNTFKIVVDGSKVTFSLSKSTHSQAERLISWDGDSNWDAPSDLRLKTDIDLEKNILNRLLRLEVKSYCWKDEPEQLTKNIGFVAQDVKPWFPSLVGEVKNSRNDETTLTLKYGAFGILAVGGLKELKLEKDGEIAELKALLHDEIAELKAQIQQLKSS